MPPGFSTQYHMGNACPTEPGHRKGILIQLGWTCDANHHQEETPTRLNTLHVPHPNLKPGCKRDLSQASRTASATSSSPPGYQGRETPPRKQLDVRTSSSIERPWQAPDYAKHQNNLCAYTLTALTPSLQSSSPNKTQSSDLTHQTEDRESMGICVGNYTWTKIFQFKLYSTPRFRICASDFACCFGLFSARFRDSDVESCSEPSLLLARSLPHSSCCHRNPKAPDHLAELSTKQCK